MAENFFKSFASNISDGVGNFFLKEKQGIAMIPTVAAGLFGANTQSVDPKKGIVKPSNVSFKMLRTIAKYDAVLRICVNVIKKQVSQSKWEIVPRKGRDLNDANVAKIEELFLVPNGNGETLRLLLDRILEDLLVLDALCVEKVYNFKGELLELNSIDAATIRPVYNQYGELDPDRAYIQVIDNKEVASFKINELIYGMINPQNDIYTFGYGMSPIESIMLAVQASLNADMYNAQSFSKDNVPPGMIDLGDMTSDEAKQFIAIWNATVTGSVDKLKFVWGRDSKKRYTPFNQNNKEMQFIEYIDWLSRLKLATYGLTAMDANITQDVNRATAEVQEGMSKARGVQTVKHFIEEIFNREILMPMGFTEEQFKFKEAVSLKDKKMQAEIYKIYIDAEVAHPKEIAEREGFEYDEFVQDNLEDEDMFDEEEDEEDLEDDSPDKLDQEIDPKDVLAEKKKMFKPLY